MKNSLEERARAYFTDEITWPQAIAFARAEVQLRRERDAEIARLLSQTIACAAILANEEES